MSLGNYPRGEKSDISCLISLENPNFGSVLRALKRHGCNLLVTGEAGEDVFAAMTRRLFGAPREQRARVLALTDAPSADASDLLPADIEMGDPRVRVLNHGNDTRFIEADVSSTATRSDRTCLVAFQEDICEAIGTVETEHEELGPAELRLGVVTLRPFVDNYEIESVVEFVRTVGSTILETDGMAHYQLPLPDDAPAVQALSPEFDARIELRKANGGPPRHRWHVPEYDLTAPWTEI